ncbi:MAG: chemotaxis protein CheW [Bacillaceae bacterium]|nr:chemotaxis protein CheW [Bacillaceae bacterium]
MTNSKWKGQYVVFTMNNQLLSVSIDEVVEIIKVQPITKVMGIKPFVCGVINLRGKIIPVVSLRQRYLLEEKEFDKKTRIIIVQEEGEQIGIIVDEVKMVTNVDIDNIEPPIEMFHQIEQDCFKGFAKVGDQLVSIFNLKKSTVSGTMAARRCSQ